MFTTFSFFKPPFFYNASRRFLFSHFLFAATVAFAGSVAALEIRVNAGGSQYTDSLSRVWAADTGFNTGRLSSTTADILGTTDDPLYQLQRYDKPAAPELTYSFAVPNGDYAINLHFAENYSGTSGVGLRLMCWWKGRWPWITWIFSVNPVVRICRWSAIFRR